jgi:transposase
MNAYSEDLRRKIVEAVERGMPKSEAARTFGVGISSVKRYVATYREGRSLAPKKRPGSKPSWVRAQGGCSKQTSKSVRPLHCRRGVSSWSGWRERALANPL